jgi:hypothetical protein
MPCSVRGHADVRSLVSTSCDPFAVAISMVVRDGGGEVIDRGAMPWAPQPTWLSPASTPLLLGIDPVGLTAFNRQQCLRQLNPEVGLLLSQHGRDHEASRMLRELGRLLTLTDRPPHRMLWFYGD